MSAKEEIKQPLGPNQEKFLAALEADEIPDSVDGVVSSPDELFRLSTLLFSFHTPLPKIASIIRSDPAMYFREVR